MAPPARLEENLPTTLPSDFGAWDEGNAAAAPEEPAPAPPALEPEAAAAPAPQPAPQLHAEAPRNRPAARPQTGYANQSAFLDQLISMRPEPGAPAHHSAQSHISAGAIYEVVPAAARTNRRLLEVPKGKTAPRKDSESGAPVTPAEPRRAQANDRAEGQPASAALTLARSLKNKKVIVAIVAGAAAVLLALSLLFFAASRSGRRPRNAGPDQQPPAAPAQPDALKPSPATPADPAAASVVVSAQPAVSAGAQPMATPQAGANAQPSVPANNPAPSPAASQMMNDQLTTPAQISAAMKTTPTDAPPPGALDTAGLGASGPAGSVLGGQPPPKVQVAPPKVVNVSSGVAIGLLIQNTPPIYPPIARTARVSGTVVLDATISKTGAIENLRVVTGPQMLRQSALDAVRTWRYKPYKLNNQPTEIETTINVVFSLKQ